MEPCRSRAHVCVCVCVSLLAVALSYLDMYAAVTSIMDAKMRDHAKQRQLRQKTGDEYVWVPMSEALHMAATVLGACLGKSSNEFKTYTSVRSCCGSMPLSSKALRVTSCFPPIHCLLPVSPAAHRGDWA